MNALFSFVLVLVACFCITITISVSNASASAAGCSESLTCLENSDSTCNNSWSQNPIICAMTSGAGCCSHGLICNNTVCQTNNFGAVCDPTAIISDCVSAVGENLVCNKVNSVATCAYQSFAGDSCDSDNICYSGLTCTDGVCVGLSVGQSCISPYSCDAGLHCTIGSLNPVCVALGTSGTSCSTSQPCVANFYCEGTCKEMFTVDSGDSCNLDLECGDGNICISHKCTEPITKLETCDTTSDCSGGICTCSPFTGDSYCLGGSNFFPCADELADALNCQAKYNCTSMGLNTESCFYQNCYSELKAGQKCECDLEDDFYGDCYYNDYCSGISGWVIFLIIIAVIVVVLVIIAVIVAVIYSVVRRKNSYNSI